MDYELLEELAELLRRAGLRAGEEYPGYQQPALDSPAAAVGLRELDIPAGLLRYNVRILSPRLLGGWCCQVWAARAVEALHGAGMTCTTEEMEYLSAGDCFCITVEASQAVAFGPAGWRPGGRMEVLCGGAEQTGVISFTASRDQGRRIQGACGQGEPIAVTPGRDGWSLELIQRVERAPEEIGEPFTLTVREGDRESRYLGCCWSQERYEHTGQGLRLIRRGFALRREEETDG